MMNEMNETNKVNDASTTPKPRGSATNELSALMEDFVGYAHNDADAVEESQPQQATEPMSLIEELGLSEELLEMLQEYRKRKSGRPLGSRTGAAKKNNTTRASFVMDRSLILKLRYIALKETRTYREVAERMARWYIAKWEDKHGEITFNSRRKRS